MPDETVPEENLPKNLTTPVALVAGASRGLGLLVARELGQLGHSVVICARDESELLSGAELLRQAGVEAAVRVCDVTDRHAVIEMVRSVEEVVGPIQTVITVAGVIMVGPLETMSIDSFTLAMDTMLWGPVNVALAVLPFMRARGAGQIGTVTSIGGMVSVPHLLPYSTAKFAAVGFSQGLSAELAGTGVTATTIVPGLMRTGGHTHALFLGQQEKEYSWFTTSASIPVLSMDAERAARLMVQAVLAGKPTVILTPMAKLGARVHGLAPATTARLMGLAARLLPKAPPDTNTTSLPGDDGQGTGQRADEGRVVQQRLNSRLLGILTKLGQRAAQRYNET